MREFSYVALGPRRLIVTRDLLILLIAHKDTARSIGNDNCELSVGPMTKVGWRAKMREGALSVLALTALLSILYVGDLRVREGATHIVSGTSNSGVARYGSQFAADTSKAVRDLREGTMNHAAMAAFVGSAAVLLLFMLKT